jgi:hypothetical protein
LRVPVEIRPYVGTALAGRYCESSFFCSSRAKQPRRHFRFFAKMVRDIEGDLKGGRSGLSRIERELIEAFAGSATAMRCMTHELQCGENAELNLAAHATLGSTMLRIGARLGLERRSLDITPDLKDYLAARSAKKAAAAREQANIAIDEAEEREADVDDEAAP